jgi:hypothetical protein
MECLLCLRQYNSSAAAVHQSRKVVSVVRKPPAAAARERGREVVAGPRGVAVQRLLDLLGDQQVARSEKCISYRLSCQKDGNMR